MMKKLLFVVGIFLGLNAEGGQSSSLPAPKCERRKTLVSNCKKKRESSISWEPYIQALSNSRSDGKVICIFFSGPEWCMWSKKMRARILTAPEFASFASDHLHMVEVEISPETLSLAGTERNKAAWLKSWYGVKNMPVLVFVSKDEQVLFRCGYEKGGAKHYIRMIQNKLDLPE